MTKGLRKGWIVVFASVVLVAVGCSSDNGGPASQGDINSQAKLLQKNSSVPDVPPENKVQTVGAGPRSAPKAPATTGGAAPGGAPPAGGTAGTGG